MLYDSKVQECMTHPAMTTAPNMPVRLAQHLMCDYHVQHLPAVKDHLLVEIFTEVDVYLLSTHASDYRVAALP